MDERQRWVRCFVGRGGPRHVLIVACVHQGEAGEAGEAGRWLRALILAVEIMCQAGEGGGGQQGGHQHRFSCLLERAYLSWASISPAPPHPVPTTCRRFKTYNGPLELQDRWVHKPVIELEQRAFNNLAVPAKLQPRMLISA